MRPSRIVRVNPIDLISSRAYLQPGTNQAARAFFLPSPRPSSPFRRRAQGTGEASSAPCLSACLLRGGGERHALRAVNVHTTHSSLPH